MLGPTSSVTASLGYFASSTLPMLLPLSLLLSLLPLPANFWLGNSGEMFFVMLAPLILLLATGAVGIVCGVSMLAQRTFGMCLRVVGFGRYVTRNFVYFPLTMSNRVREDPNVHMAERRLVSTGVAVALIVILVFVPWQVAFLGCWIYHFYTCTAGLSSASLPLPVTPSIPLIIRRPPSASPPRSPPRSPPSSHGGLTPSTHHQNEHLLLLLTLLLPLAAPVLAVWVRTLANAGLTAPWNADHNILCIAPALMLVERAGEGERIYRGG